MTRGSDRRGGGYTRDRRVPAVAWSLLAVVVAAFLMAASFAPAHAYAASGETVRVGYYENEVFQEGAQEGAVKTGYAYEYYLKISEYTGWKYEYVYGSYGDLYGQLLSGDIDLLAGLAWKEDRAGLIGYPESPMGHETYNLVKHGSDTDVNAEASTLEGKRIGVLQSAMTDVLQHYLDEHGVSAEVVPFEDYQDLFDAFDKNEVDVLAAEGDGAYGRDDAEVIGSFGASDYYLCVAASRSDLLAELDAAQSLLRADEPDYLSLLNSKYYSLSVASRAYSPVERDWLSSHDELRVGYLENYLPYSDTDAEGRATGLVGDIVPQMLAGLGITDLTVTYQGFENYDDLIAAVNDGTVDVAFPVGGGLYYSEENGIHQSSPVASTSTELVYKGELSEGTFNRFSVNENNRMQYYYVKTNYPDAEVAFYPSTDACLEAVISGEVSCTTLNGLRANDIMKNRKYRDLTLYQLANSDDRGFGVKIGNEGLLRLVNRGIGVVGSDYAEEQSLRYTDGLYKYTPLDFVADHIAAFAIAALVLAALVIAALVRYLRNSRARAREQDLAQAALQETNRELELSREALSDALEDAKRANSAKTMFLNNMSHDIRTPMNAIVGFTALASEHADDRDQVRDYLGKISVSSRHLLSLINDVLDMSRIESGNMALEETDVHLPDVIDDLRTIVLPDVSAKGLDLSVGMHDVVHEDVVTDKLRLNQVLLNILSNAIKFTPEGGSISLRVTELGSDEPGATSLEFRVEDNGIGMSEEFQETIFEAFTREKTSTVSGVQGTGLGMAITKNIVDTMGGSIQVRSEVGKGSEFVVTIPCGIGEGPAESAQLLNLESLRGMRVLVAEDNELNRIIASAILEEAGVVVDIAEDGEEALRKVDESPAGSYDAVLMDIQMPRMDGYEAARQIRALPDAEKASVPIVAVTANAFEEDKANALEAGMNGHLPKPYDSQAMLDMLCSL